MIGATRPRRRGGFTLAEILVVAFLGAIVLFLLGQLLVPSAILFRMQTAKADVHQGALVFTYWVDRHLSNSALETVTIVPWPKPVDPLVASSPAISFREISESDPYDGVTGVAKMLPEFRILWFDEPNHRVVIKRWPPDPPTLTFDFTTPGAIPCLSPEDLAQICNGENGSERVLVKNVESLVITDDDGDLTQLTPPLRLTITCAETGRDQRAVQDEKATERFTMTARVTPRNVRW